MNPCESAMEVIRSNSNPRMKQVIGYVGSREIISANNFVDGKWAIMASACLPSDITVATAHVQCMFDVVNLVNTFIKES